VIGPNRMLDEEKWPFFCIKNSILAIFLHQAFYLGGTSDSVVSKTAIFPGMREGNVAPLNVVIEQVPN